MPLFLLATIVLGWTVAPSLAHALLARREVREDPPQLPMARALLGRTICAAILALYGVCCWHALPFALCLVTTVGALVMLCTLICDCRARIIPWELSLGLMALGITKHVLMGNPLHIAYTLALGCCVAGFLWLSIKCGDRLGRGACIGAGDLRLIPALCVFTGVAGAFAGAMLCATVMGLWALALLIMRRVARDGTLPVAPGFASWFALESLCA